MHIFKEIGPMRAFLNDLKMQGKTIGLVPTMGALHEGHSSLVKESRIQNDLTITSIYVNPAQFNSPSDLENYPRSLTQDIEMLSGAGSDVLFCPDNKEMYGKPSSLKFDFGELDKILEGKFRPGHFSGVGLVVSKLFNIIQPHNAYFGQKDYQQFLIICRMVEELKFNVTLHCIPIVREASGLALSSRNKRLSDSEKKSATVFSRGLIHAKTELKTKPWQQVKEEILRLFGKESNVRLEYFELADRENLLILSNVDRARPSVLVVAGYVGEVRLIDNMFLDY